MKSTLATLVLVAACVGCDAPTASSPAVPSASARPAGSASAAQPSPEKSQGFFTGEWSGTYEARQYLIEMTKQQGAVKNWSEDKGQEHTGKGALSLRIAEDGSVSGSSSGPLGELSATGALDGDVVRVRFTPVTATERAFSGWLLAKRDGDALKGRLQAGTGDSNTVRDAPVELRRGGAERKE